MRLQEELLQLLVGNSRSQDVSELVNYLTRHFELYDYDGDAPGNGTSSRQTRKRRRCILST